MPADNVEGFRAELIALLREVRPTTLRWGGNFSTGYEWRDGISPQAERARARSWPVLQMEADHNPMWSKPVELADLLESIR